MDERGAMSVRRAKGGAVAALPGDDVAENLEVGYATTAREPLYVMSTRGRGSNRLYVDTVHHPDETTNHGENVQADPLEVLQTVISTTGADLSATETRSREEVAASATWRVEAQGTAAIAMTPSHAARRI